MTSNSAPTEEPNPPLIVVAEDDPAMRALVASCLRTDGYDVVEAADGDELLFIIHWAKAFPHASERPALVFSDIRMPNASGMDVLARVREEMHTVPFVILSGFADAATRQTAKELGALLVLSKPVDMFQLRWLVANLVPLTSA